MTKPPPIFIQLPTHTCCLKCGARDLFMIGLYRCDRHDISARRCGGVLRQESKP
jgi:hypothetical protein